MIDRKYRGKLCNAPGDAILAVREALTLFIQE